MAYTGIYAKAVSQGNNYKTGNLLQDIDNNFSQAYNDTVNTYVGTFTNSNLVDGVLTVTHNLGTEYPAPTIKRPDNTYENALDIMTWVSNNQVTFDFGGSISVGTWKIQIKK